MKQISLAIDGMTCDHCVAAVRKAIESVDGVTATDVAIGTATVQTMNALPSLDAIKAAIEEAGYFAEVEQP